MNFLEIYKNLLEYFGSQHWWPVLNKKNIDPRFEIIVGAILTQNTAWTNVEKALKNLSEKKLLDRKNMSEVQEEILEKMIRPAGYFRQKAKKLKKFLQHLEKYYNNNFDLFLKTPLKNLRAELLSVWGIGEETADSIILYAAKKPSFVIDAYTRRLCAYHGIEFSKYQEYKDFFESQLPKSAKFFGEYHALIVAWGKLESKKETKTLAQKLIGVI